MIEGGYMYGMQRRVNDVTHWQCEQRGVCKARVHTKGMDIHCLAISICTDQNFHSYFFAFICSL